MTNTQEQRKGDRTRSLKPTRIRLKGGSFTVHDISSGGIGIVLEEAGPKFFIGERLDAIALPLEDGTRTLKGVVSHISVTSRGRVCGIRFLLGGDDFDAVIRFRKERTEPAV